MPDQPLPAPYRSSRKFASLQSYRRLGVPDDWWAAQQFQLELHRAPDRGPDFDSRSRTIFEAMDTLPLQVKDLIRGTVDRIRIDGGESFRSETLGTWRAGTIRLNGDWPQIPALQRYSAQPDDGYRLLRATLVHECGHALVEDPRGGIPMGDVVRLAAASGWLPDPIDDPVPFGPLGEDLSSLTQHYLDRLGRIDPGWDPAVPLGRPGSPPTLQLDRDLMSRVPVATEARTKWRATLGLKGPNRLAQELRVGLGTANLDAALAGVGLSRAGVERAIQRRYPVSPYAEESIAETPAEIFRVLHTPVARPRAQAPALDEGERLLIEPWRVAERTMATRAAPAQPWPTLKKLAWRSRQGPAKSREPER